MSDLPQTVPLLCVPITALFSGQRDVPLMCHCRAVIALMAQYFYLHEAVVRKAYTTVLQLVVVVGCVGRAFSSHKMADLLLSPSRAYSSLADMGRQFLKRSGDDMIAFINQKVRQLNAPVAITDTVSLDLVYKPIISHRFGFVRRRLVASRCWE